MYKDDKVRITKTIKSTGRPYELDAEAVIENLADKKLSHALTVETDEWRTNAEVSGHMFRVSPFVTHVECIPVDGGKAKRLRKEDFEPDDFEGEPFTGPLNPGDWYQAASKGGYGAVSNAYFSHAIVPLASAQAGEPVCQLQIEERWDPSQLRKREEGPQAPAPCTARAWPTSP